MNMLMRALIGVVFLGHLTVAFAEPTLLRFARLIDGTGEALDAREIVVDDGAILAVGSDLDARYPGAMQIVLDDLVGLPGLIDAHVHVTYGLAGPSQGDGWTELFSTPAPERLVASTRNARRTLETGVTSARDLSGFDGVDYQLKALIDAGVVPGPRLFLSGPGIHPLTLKPLAEGETRDTVAEFIELTEQRIAEGAEWLKIFATTGSADDLTGQQLFFYPEIKAATDTAHAAGLKVALHSYGPSAVSDALRAGVDSIEHPVGLDDLLLKQWAATDTIYVPTIDHNRYYADHRDEYGYDETVESDLHKFVQRNVESLRLAHQAGLTIAMGSDAVMSGFGQNTLELEWFIKAGMTNAEAIQTATVNGARLIGQEQTLGRLQSGFAADIVAVEGDPLRDIDALTRNVKWVMKNGEVVVDRVREERGER